MRTLTGRSGEGFTLIEVLVIIALLAAIVAIVSPTLFSQILKGDVTHLTGDATSVGSAVKTFRVDVSPTLPGDVEDLVHRITTSDQSVEDVAYVQAQVNRWNGPYLEIDVAEGDVAASTDVAFETAFGGSVLSDLWRFQSASTTSAITTTEPSTTNYDWISLRVDQISQDAFDAVDEEADGGDGADAGRYRYDSGNAILYYLAAQN